MVTLFLCRFVFTSFLLSCVLSSDIRSFPLSFPLPFFVFSFPNFIPCLLLCPPYILIPSYVSFNSQMDWGLRPSCYATHSVCVYRMNYDLASAYVMRVGQGDFDKRSGKYAVHSKVLYMYLFYYVLRKPTTDKLRMVSGGSFEPDYLPSTSQYSVTLGSQGFASSWDLRFSMR
jgi:hypothetical protein